MEHFQNLQDRLNKIYSFPSSIIDNDGNILTATAWQDVCTKFHRKNKETEQLCIKSDQYISDHIHEAKPAISYRCPHGLMDNATPIIIDGIHYGNFFTGQFFLEKPDPQLFRTQAQKYGFDEEAYIAAVKKAPIWTREQLENYLYFIKGLIAVISESGMKKLKEIEQRKQIQKSEKRYRSILKAAIDGYWLTDINGRLLEVNDAYCRMSGYNEDELLSMHISELEFVETPEIVAEHMQAVVMKGSDRFETRHCRKDGTLLDVEVSIQFRPEDNGQCVCFLRDITRQKKTEKTLYASRQNLENIIDHLPVGIGILDDKGNILRINQQFKKMFGYTENDISTVDNWAVKAYPDKDYRKKVLKIWDQYLRKVFETGVNTPPVDVEITCKDKTTRNILISLQPGDNQHLTTFVDITERKQAEKALEEKSKFLQNIIDTTSDLVAVTDMEGNFKFIGPAHRFLGYDPDSLIGRNVMEFVHPDDYQETATAFAEFLANREDGRKVEYRYHRADGDYLWFETVGKFILDDAGNPKEILFSSRDVTERKQAEDALKKSEEKYRLITENMAEIITTMDMNLNFTYVSPSIIKLRGFTDEEALEQKIDQIMTPESFQRLSKVFAEEFSLEQTGTADLGRSRLIELEEYKKDGSTIWIENTASFIRDSYQKPIGIISISRDITDRKKAEDALRESESRFKALHNASFGGIAIHDQGVILECNQGLSEMTGYEYSELIGMNGLLLIAEKSRKQVMNNIRTGYEKPYEAFGLRKNGEEFPMQLEARNVPYKGKQVRTVEFRDITERKRAEEELKRSEENYRLLVENQTDLVVKVDLDGRFLFVSPSYCRMFDKKETEILGKHFMPLVHEDDREPTAKAMETLFSPPHTAYIE
ncbi:MAG: PAS domain S-box protein, partial [Desulfobacteraceae bacterium]|nr:PAS domain S-box protein [Desulfobacteraceae bacterium]